MRRLLLAAEASPMQAVHLFSSASAAVGNAGQAAYAAANAALECAAAVRSDTGWPATALAWGPWAARGMATARQTQLHRAGARLSCKTAAVSSQRLVANHCVAHTCTRTRTRTRTRMRARAHTHTHTHTCQQSRVRTIYHAVKPMPAFVTCMTIAQVLACWRPRMACASSPRRSRPTSMRQHLARQWRCTAWRAPLLGLCFCGHQAVDPRSTASLRLPSMQRPCHRGAPLACQCTWLTRRLLRMHTMMTLWACSGACARWCRR